MGYRIAACWLILCGVVCGQGVIVNDRLTVFDGTDFPGGPTSSDMIRIQTESHKAAFFKKGALIPPAGGKREVRITLKDHAVAPITNRTPYQNAFPRPGSKKLFENRRVIIWEYTWKPGVATPMHFHDKDVVVVYFENGTLRSTTPDGMVTDNPYTPSTVRFNLRERTHTETLVTGKQHAIMTELK